MSENRMRVFNDCKPAVYYFQTANIIDDLPLSVYAYRLYGRLVRVSSLSNADVSTRALAEACHMSMGMVSKAKAELVSHGLISIVKKPSGKRMDYDEIHILDITMRNAEHCRKDADSSCGELNSSCGELNSSCGEHLSITGNNKREKTPLSTKRITFNDDAIPAHLKNQKAPPRNRKPFKLGTWKGYDPNPANRAPAVKLYRRIFPYVRLDRRETQSICGTFKDVERFEVVLRYWKTGVDSTRKWSPRNWRGLQEQYDKLAFSAADVVNPDAHVKRSTVVYEPVYN